MSTASPNTLAEILAAGPQPGQMVLTATLVTEMTEALTKASKSMSTLSQQLDCPCCSAPRRARRELPSAGHWSPQLVEDLRGAARAIRRLGWVRGNFVTPSGVCALGGAMVTISGHDLPPQEWFDPAVGRPDWIKRMRAVTCAMREWIGGSLPAFNDRSVTGPEEVIAELEACAAAVERALIRRSAELYRTNQRHERISGALSRRFVYTPAPRFSEVLTVPEEWVTAEELTFHVDPAKVLEPA